MTQQTGRRAADRRELSGERCPSHGNLLETAVCARRMTRRESEGCRRGQRGKRVDPALREQRPKVAVSEAEGPGRERTLKGETVPYRAVRPVQQLRCCGAARVHAAWQSGRLRGRFCAPSHEREQRPVSSQTRRLHVDDVRKRQTNLFQHAQRCDSGVSDSRCAIDGSNIFRLQCSQKRLK